MKKIILGFMVLLLTGCTNEFVKMGYLEEDLPIIETLNEENLEYFKTLPVDDTYLDLIAHPEFNQDYFERYIQYWKNFDLESVLYYVNEGFSDSEIERLKSLRNDDAYILEYSERYLASDTGDDRETIEYVNAWIDREFYVDYVETDISKGDLMLVNKYHRLSEDYEPSNLVQIEAQYGIQGYLQEHCYEAYKEMVEAANAAGVSLTINSPYRAYHRQESLYNYYLLSDTVEEVDTYSARPGFSEHQTGLAIDILSYVSDFSNFEYTNSASWLKANSYKYGFILRYPENKIHITGYIYEPWHYRYVGEIAEDVYLSGLTYDEYYMRYIASENER